MSLIKVCPWCKGNATICPLCGGSGDVVTERCNVKLSRRLRKSNSYELSTVGLSDLLGVL